MQVIDIDTHDVYRMCRLGALKRAAPRCDNRNFSVCLLLFDRLRPRVAIFWFSRPRLPTRNRILILPPIGQCGLLQCTIVLQGPQTSCGARCCCIPITTVLPKYETRDTLVAVPADSTYTTSSLAISTSREGRAQRKQARSDKLGRQAPGL